jgi:hypothetical protein
MSGAMPPCVDFGKGGCADEEDSGAFSVEAMGYLS